jgi:hypothetical protein
MDFVVTRRYPALDPCYFCKKAGCGLLSRFQLMISGLIWLRRPGRACRGLPAERVRVIMHKQIRVTGLPIHQVAGEFFLVTPMKI